MDTGGRPVHGDPLLAGAPQPGTSLLSEFGTGVLISESGWFTGRVTRGDGQLQEQQRLGFPQRAVSAGETAGNTWPLLSGPPQLMEIRPRDPSLDRPGPDAGGRAEPTVAGVT